MCMIHLFQGQLRANHNRPHMPQKKKRGEENSQGWREKGRPTETQFVCKCLDATCSS